MKRNFPIPEHMNPPTRASRLPLLLLVLALCVGATVSTSHAQTTFPDLDQWIEAERERWGIPGLAVAVVKDDEVVYARGFGVRKLGEPQPVDENTLFGIASVSKAFTVGAIGLLVDDGLLHWDDPVVQHLPGFKLYDPYVTQHTTIRDLLSHRVGVGRMTGNRLRWLPSRERSELTYRMRYHEPEQPFRDRYVYSNVMYMVAGEVVEAVSGMSWEDFVKTRIFAPLGMERSNTSITEIRDGENAAWPHQEIEGEVVVIPRRNFDAVGPAASINSTVMELLPWMRMQIGEQPGMVDGRRLLSEEVVREMHRAQVRLPDAGLSGGVASYAMGWRASMYEGRRMSTHSGATDGMNTNMVLVPEENLGIVVVTNTFNNLMNALTNRIVDEVLGLPDRRWGERFWMSYQARYAAAQAERDSIHAARAEGTAPTLALDAYTGTFEDDLYADAEVRLEHGGLVLQFWSDPDMIADLEHWHHDTFRAVWRNRSMREEFVYFTRGRDGGMDHLHIEWVLRPALLQVGAYPSSYTREATLVRSE